MSSPARAVLENLGIVLSDCESAMRTFAQSMAGFRARAQEDMQRSIEIEQQVPQLSLVTFQPPQSPNPCCTCANYVGGRYRSDHGDHHPTLICGLHPYGPDGDDCPDWESRESPEAQRRSEEARERSRNAEREAAERRQGWRRTSVTDVFWDEVEQELPRADLTGLVDIVLVNGELQIEPRHNFDPAFIRWPLRILVRHELLGNNYIVEFPQCVWNYAEQRIEALTPRGWFHSWQMTLVR